MLSASSAMSESQDGSSVINSHRFYSDEQVAQGMESKRGRRNQSHYRSQAERDNVVLNEASYLGYDMEHRMSQRFSSS